MTFKDRIKELSGIHLVPSKFIDHIKAIMHGDIQYLPASTIAVNFEQQDLSTNMVIPNIKCNIDQNELSVVFNDDRPKTNVNISKIGANL